MHLRSRRGVGPDPKLIDLDGDKVSAAEKRARIKDPPAVVKEAKANDEEKEYMGKKVTVKLFEQTNSLMTCFDNPERTLETVTGVQDRLLKLIPMDPRGRIMFDYEQEDTRDELELMDEEEDNEDEQANKSEHGTDYRPPAEIIEEYIQTLMLLVERQPAVAPKVLRLVVLALSLDNEGLAGRSLEQLLDLLEAGSIGEVVVETIMQTLLPQLKHAQPPTVPPPPPPPPPPHGPPPHTPLPLTSSSLVPHATPSRTSLPPLRAQPPAQPPLKPMLLRPAQLPR